MMRIDPQRLLRLAVLINQRSFRKAADELGLTQPALSQSIAQLESEVGVQLIERTPYGIEPTIYGEALYKHAKAVDWELTQATRQIQELAFGHKGSLTIGATSGAAVFMVCNAICRLQTSRPGIQAHIVEESTAKSLLAQLYDRTLDLLICQRPTELELKGGQAVPLFHSRRVACIRAGHPLGNKPSLDQLSRYPFACPLDQMGILSEVKKIFADEGLEMPAQKIIISNSIAAAKEIILRSDAFAIFSDLSVWTERDTGQFIAIELPHQDGYWHHLIARPEHVATDVIKNFLREVFATCTDLDVPVHSDALRFEQRIPALRRVEIPG